MNGEHCHSQRQRQLRRHQRQLRWAEGVGGEERKEEGGRGGGGVMRGEVRESLSVNVFHLMSLLLMFFVCVRKKHLHLKRGRQLGKGFSLCEGNERRRGGGRGVGGVAGYMVSEQRFSLNDFYCSFVVNLLCN